MLVLGLILYLIFGGSSSAAETWSGPAVSLVTATGGACATGTSEGIGTRAGAISSATSGEGSCGPCMVPNAGLDTQIHCNRDYTFGQGYQSFFTEYAGRQLTLIQDAHDPNDINWDRTGVVDTTTMHSSTLFATVTIPAGAEATIHCFVPVGCQAEHAHTPNEYPNMVDPQGGWTESSESYMEDNGIERRRFFKKVTASGDTAIEYPLQYVCRRSVPLPHDFHAWSEQAADTFPTYHCIAATRHTRGGATCISSNCRRQAIALCTRRRRTRLS